MIKVDYSPSANILKLQIMEKEQATSASSPFTIDPETIVGHVHLRVLNLQRTIEYYRDLLGFRTSGQSTEKHAFLTAEGAPSYLIALSRAPQEPELLKRRAGLYHFAILLPDRKSLSQILRHIMKNIEKANFEGAADHGVSEALYLQDPEGNGIEIYHDRPRPEWRWNKNRIEMTTKSLDEEGLLKESKEDWSVMPEGTKIGHVHLHVSNLQESEGFYSGALGLKLTSALPSAYFYAADEYHHHVATNTWAGEGISPLSKTQPGLDHFALNLPNEEALHHLLRNLSWKAISTEKSDELEFSHSVYVYDPDGIKIQLHVG